MEIPFLHNITNAKSENVASKVKVADRSKVAAYEQAGTASESDKLSLSAKAKLMSNLRGAFDALPKDKVTPQAVQNKLAEQGFSSLSSEEIIASILHGTLFQAL